MNKDKYQNSNKIAIDASAERFNELIYILAQADARCLVKIAGSKIIKNKLFPAENVLDKRG